MATTTNVPAQYKNLENHPSDGTVTAPEPFFYHSHKETTPVETPKSADDKKPAEETPEKKPTETPETPSTPTGGAAKQSSSVTLNTDDQQQATPAKAI